MNLKDLKDRVKDAVETENPSGIGYYGAEVDENEVDTARERMDESTRVHDEAAGDNQLPQSPSTRQQQP